MSYSELYRVVPLYPCLVELQAIENDTGDHGRSHTQPAAAKALLQFCSIVRRFYTGKLDDRSLFYLWPAQNACVSTDNAVESAICSQSYVRVFGIMCPLAGVPHVRPIKVSMLSSLPPPSRSFVPLDSMPAGV